MSTWSGEMTMSAAGRVGAAAQLLRQLGALDILVRTQHMADWAPLKAGVITRGDGSSDVLYLWRTDAR